MKNLWKALEAMTGKKESGRQLIKGTIIKAATTVATIANPIGKLEETLKHRHQGYKHKGSGKVDYLPLIRPSHWFKAALRSVSSLALVAHYAKGQSDLCSFGLLVTILHCKLEIC